MRWVTYYEHVMMGGKVADIVVHKDKESATKYFKSHYKNYFQLNPKYLKVELPISYGLGFRSFNGVSLLTFKCIMMKRLGISEKEFNRQLKELESKEDEK